MESVLSKSNNNSPNERRRMMDPYTIELLAKERQRELDEEMKRIHLARAARKPGPGIIRIYLGLLGDIIFNAKPHAKSLSPKYLKR
jgi:hypothetical protein